MFFKRDRGSSEAWLVVALGNIGSQYENTRHNAGFLAAKRFCNEYGIDLNKKKFNAVFGETQIDGIKVIVAFPQTFMNNSGEAAGPLARFYKIPPDRVLVLSDDISLDVGRMRIRAKGSDGGHNGLKSIIKHLSTDGFPRIKIGVGQKPDPQYDLAAWVLGKIPDEQQKNYLECLEKAAKAIPEIIKNGVQSAMNKYNG